MKVPYNTVVFLAAYTRQAHLSLDRALWVDIDDLREFYSHQVSPGEIAAIIIQNCEGVSNNIKGRELKKPFGIPSFGRRFLLTLKRWIGIVDIEDKYWQCLYDKSIELEILLNSREQRGYDLLWKIAPLMHSFSALYFNKLAYVLKSADSKKVNRVEHFNQAPHIETIPLAYFLTPPPLPPSQNNK